MKHKMLISGVVGLIVLGGVAGVSAYTDTNQPTTDRKNNLITMEKAETIALNHVSGTVESIELEKDDGRYEYEIEVQTAKGDDDTELVVDGISGQINKIADDDVNENNQAQYQTGRTKLTKEEAIAIALKDTPGTVVDVEFDDGEYEIEIRDGNKEVEYEISARTGKILEKDVEFDDDDDDRDR